MTLGWSDHVILWYNDLCFSLTNWKGSLVDLHAQRCVIHSEILAGIHLGEKYTGKNIQVPREAFVNERRAPTKGG